MPSRSDVFPEIGLFDMPPSIANIEATWLGLPDAMSAALSAENSDSLCHASNASRMGVEIKPNPANDADIPTPCVSVSARE
jgi:hypothetical protein